MHDDIELIVIFIFYNIAQGKQARLSFSDEFKHCNVVTFDGRDWIMLDFDRAGFLTRKINCHNGFQLLRTLPKVKEISATLGISVSKRKKILWKPYLVRSCNEICRYASGVDIGLTFNPVHLYRKLIKYRNNRNYQILSAWRRKDGILRRRQRTEQEGSGSTEPSSPFVGSTD